MRIQPVHIGQHVVAYPISHGTLINVAAFHSWPDKAGTKYNGKMIDEHTTEVLVNSYAGWEEEVIQLLKVSFLRKALVMHILTPRGT